MGDKNTEFLKRSYEFAKKNKGEDRLTDADVKMAKKVIGTRMSYEIAQENKGEDRITQRDIEMAKESLPKFSNGGGVAIQGTKFTGVK